MYHMDGEEKLKLLLDLISGVRLRPLRHFRERESEAA